MIIYLQMIESDEDKSKFEQLYIMYKGLMFHVAMKILKNEFDACLLYTSPSPRDA